MFGGIDCDTRECFAIPVECRDAATFLPIIRQFILPGTTILSDQWAYNTIASDPNNYEHLTVNHSVNFVDPETYAHTQNVENMWMCMKGKKKQQMGQHNSLLPTHLAEFMWHRKFADRPLENLIRCTQVKLGTSEPIGSVEFRRFPCDRIPIQISSDEFRSVPMGSVDF